MIALRDPFDPVRRLSIAVIEGPAWRHTLVMKGAVEEVLDRCVLDGPTRERARATAGAMAADGLRVLAVAVRDLGLTPGVVVTGAEVETLTDGELAELAGRTTVFARCALDHKARVVEALRRAGHTTGFMGAGSTTCPRWARPTSGCPRDAVDVTREVADVVLAAKDLTAIDQAIELGRSSTGNVATYLRVALSSNFGNVIAMVTAGVLPGQVQVQNLCFDAAQLAFAFERPDPAVTRRPARLRPRGILSFIATFGVLNALADLGAFTVLRLALPEAGGQAAFQTGWFVENLFTQALVMLLLRPTRQVTWPLGVAVTGLAAVGLLLPLSPFASALGLVTLPSGYYVLLTVVLCLYGTTLAVLTRRISPYL